MFPDSRAGCTFPSQNPGELGELLAQTQSCLICPCFIHANWNCSQDESASWPDICLGMLRGFPQNISALTVLCSLGGGPWVRIDKVPKVLSIKSRRWVHIAHWFLFYIICKWAQANKWVSHGPSSANEGLGSTELRAPPCLKFIDFMVISFIYLFHVYECFIWMYVWAPCASLLPARSEGGHQIP